ncbi:hypothetical protein KC347_g311 [Hortaea werneckii]|nr:hypothetical protein KC347_g311 [Hortaea werneckii]
MHRYRDRGSSLSECGYNPCLHRQDGIGYCKPLGRRVRMARESLASSVYVSLQPHGGCRLRMSRLQIDRADRPSLTQIHDNWAPRERKAGMTRLCRWGWRRTRRYRICNSTRCQAAQFQGPTRPVRRDPKLHLNSTPPALRLAWLAAIGLFDFSLLHSLDSKESYRTVPGTPMKHYQGAHIPLLYPGSEPALLLIFCTLAERFCRLPPQLLCCAVCRSDTVPDIPQSSINPLDWNRSTRCAFHAANNLGDRAAIARAQIVCTEGLRAVERSREGCKIRSRTRPRNGSLPTGLKYLRALRKNTSSDRKEKSGLWHQGSLAPSLSSAARPRLLCSRRQSRRMKTRSCLCRNRQARPEARPIRKRCSGSEVNYAFDVRQSCTDSILDSIPSQHWAHQRTAIVQLVKDEGRRLCASFRVVLLCESPDLVHSSVSLSPAYKPSALSTLDRLVNEFKDDEDSEESDELDRRMMLSERRAELLDGVTNLDPQYRREMLELSRYSGPTFQVGDRQPGLPGHRPSSRNAKLKLRSETELAIPLRGVVDAFGLSHWEYARGVQETPCTKQDGVTKRRLSRRLNREQRRVAWSPSWLRTGTSLLRSQRRYLLRNQDSHS